MRGSDSRPIDAARRVAAEWLGRNWADPPIGQVVSAARLLIESAAPLPDEPAHAATRAAWRYVIAALGGGCARLDELWACLQAEAPRQIDTAIWLARERLAEPLAWRLVEDGDPRAVQLLPALRSADAHLARRIVAVLEPSNIDHIKVLADALLAARDACDPWGLCEQAWSLFESQMGLPNDLAGWVEAARGQMTGVERAWLHAQLRVLSRTHLDGAVELLEQLRSYAGLARIDTADAVLGRVLRVDPGRAWELVEGSADEELAAGLRALATGGPLPVPAVSALDALLAGTDCVSEWDEWMDVLRVAVWDGQIDLVARETSRPELDEPCGSMTQRELTCGSLATEVAVLAARGDASGAAALFTMLEAHVSEARRDGFVVDAFARRAPPDPS